jgi:hypothetical protein
MTIGGRLLIHLNPCIPTNVTPKTGVSDQIGPSRNGHLRLRAAPAITSPREPEPFPTSLALRSTNRSNRARNSGSRPGISFEHGATALGVLFAADAQLTNWNPFFGHGVRGWAHYFGTAYADYVIGDYMTEAVLPTVLYQDPRYLGAAQEMAGRDSISCWPDFLDPQRFGWRTIQFLGDRGRLDCRRNLDGILKEFRQDLERKFSSKHK